MCVLPMEVVTDCILPHLRGKDAARLGSTCRTLRTEYRRRTPLIERLFHATAALGPAHSDAIRDAFSLVHDWTCEYFYECDVTGMCVLYVALGDTESYEVYSSAPGHGHPRGVVSLRRTQPGEWWIEFQDSMTTLRPSGMWGRWTIHTAVAAIAAVLDVFRAHHPQFDDSRLASVLVWTSPNTVHHNTDEIRRCLAARAIAPPTEGELLARLGP